MRKSILQSIITVAVYFLIIKLLGALFNFILVREEFIDINESYLYFLDTIVYLILTISALLFIKKWKGKTIEKGNISLKNVLLIIGVVIFYRFLEDPFLRLDIITGTNNFPIIQDDISDNTVRFISSFLNVVLLGALFEELLFRKIILDFFKPRYLILGVLFSSFLFALIHIKGSYINYTTLLLAFVFGVLACIVCIKYGLVYSLLLHIGYNFVWLYLQINKMMYWEILKELNFGYIYWTLIIISLGIITLFVYKNFASIFNKKN